MISKVTKVYLTNRRNFVSLLSKKIQENPIENESPI
jgi:hypothetical protein